MHAASKRGSDAPVLVVESALSQSSNNLIDDLMHWTTPRAAGGATLAVGLDVKRARNYFAVHVVEVGMTTAPDPLLFGACLAAGNPEFFIWLALSKLMPGSSLAMRLWLSARIAAGRGRYP